VKLTLWKWVFWWGILGLLVPAVLTLRWKLLGSMFGQIEAILWPSSIMLMILEGSVSIFYILLVYAIAWAGNVMTYSGIGLLTWPAIRFVQRRRAQSHQ
jgi:hypothetical protein